jgi:hypothetical protein
VCADSLASNKFGDFVSQLSLTTERAAHRACNPVLAAAMAFAITNSYDSRLSDIAILLDAVSEILIFRIVRRRTLLVAGSVLIALPCPCITSRALANRIADAGVNLFALLKRTEAGTGPMFISNFVPTGKMDLTLNR